MRHLIWVTINESDYENLFRLNPENIMLIHTLMHQKIKQWMYRPMYVSLTDRSKINSNRPVPGPGGPGVLDFSRKNKSRLFLMKFKVEFYNILASFITFWRYQYRKIINSHKTDAFYGFLAAEMDEMSYRNESLSDLVLRNWSIFRVIFFMGID